MGPTIVAVAGTLLGSLLTLLAGDWRARAAQRRSEFPAANQKVIDSEQALPRWRRGPT